jgi:flagellar motility protein MotE (MotC chaperone)
MKEFFSALLYRFRLLPLLVIVAMLAFAVRLGEAVIQVHDLSGSSFAAAEPPQAELAKPDVKDPSLPPSVAESTALTGSTAATSEGAAAAASPPAWSDASDADIDYSNVRKELYNDLLARRQQLDEKEKVLAQREALIDAGEKEIGKKYDELTALRNEIQELLKKQSAEESARIASLVKIYEGMKAKDAARIFNTLDMDILLDVVSKMSERKSAPIIAEMDAERARALTTLLAEQKKLPELPADTPNIR